MNINGRYDWKLFAHSGRFQEWKVKPLAKLLAKMGLVKGISDENSQVHYVSKTAFKKWAENWNISYKPGILSLEDLVNEVQAQSQLKAGSGKLLKEKIGHFQFPSEITPETQNKIEAFMLRHLSYKSSPGDQRYYCESPQLPRGFRAEWDEEGDLMRVTLFAKGKSDFDEHSIDLYWTSQGPLRPLRTVDSYLHWPQNVGRTIGISPRDQKRIDRYIRDNFELLKDVGKNPLRLKWDRTGLPVSLLCVPDQLGQLKKIILLPDTTSTGIVGRGGQRVVKAAFDLTEGHRLVRKKMTAEEMAVIQQVEDMPAMTETAAFRLKNAKTMLHQQLEVRESGTLDELLWIPMTSEQQVQMVRGLLTQLKEFHQKKTEEDIPAFHSDIKMSNILFRLAQNGEFELTLSDFGLANLTNSVTGTIPTSAPEHLKAWFQKDTKLIKNHHRNYGQANDAWSLGLVLVGIVTRGQTLPYIYQAMNQTGSYSNETVKRLSQVEQDEVTLSIETMKARYLPQSPLWPVIERLLKVDPKERYTSAQALELLD